MLSEEDVAIVKRVVPGKIVYVEKAPSKEYAFKLNEIEILQPDGSTCPYRGEPLSELRLMIGQKVFVHDSAREEPTLIVNPLSTLPSSGTIAIRALKDILKF